MSSAQRDCPICGGRGGKAAFPYRTRFNGNDFYYIKCTNCATVFVNPVPDPETFGRMYAKHDYHDLHYSEVQQVDYKTSAGLLAQHLSVGQKVLDYGCGVGAFLVACRDRGFVPIGVDFDQDVARAAGVRAECESMSASAFEEITVDVTFDAIHLGDVLEHLPDPLTTINGLVARLRPGGILYVEGPLEVNPSPVYWAARIFGRIKRTVTPSHVGLSPPTHLLRTDAVSQKRFFSRLGQNLMLEAWQMNETGWPYATGGMIKRSIASVAKVIGGRRYFGIDFGNRFRAILVKHAQ